MKKVFLFVLFPFFAIAGQKVNTKHATLAICPQGPNRPILLGCANSIHIGSKSYLYVMDKSADSKLEKCFNAVIGAYGFHGVRQSPEFDVKGYVVKEKGHFPNPTAEFDVIHVTDSVKICHIPLPR